MCGTTGDSIEDPPRRWDCGTVAVGSDSIYFEAFGEGEPLVFLHGGMASGREWRGFAPLLAADFQGLVYDRRGVGRSSGEPFRADIVTRGVDELSELLDRRGIERAHLYGSCIGGAIALTMAAREPERVSSVVASAVLYRGSLELRERLGRLFRPWERMPAWFHESMSRVHGGPDVPAFYDAFRRIYAEGGSVGYASSPEYDLTALLPVIDRPVLVLHGDRDPFWGVEQAAAAYRLLASSALWIVPACAHYPHLEHAEDAARQARRFLAEVQSRAHGAVGKG